MDEDSNKVEILIGVSEGPRWMVTSVDFAGNRVLDDAALERLVKLRPGAPFVAASLATPLLLAIGITFG